MQTTSALRTKRQIVIQKNKNKTNVQQSDGRADLGMIKGSVHDRKHGNMVLRQDVYSLMIMMQQYIFRGLHKHPVCQCIEKCIHWWFETDRVILNSIEHAFHLWRKDPNEKQRLKEAATERKCNSLAMSVGHQRDEVLTSKRHKKIMYINLL